ncbi:ATP-binding cassette domain-containing protein [Kitasatospora sp. NBC_01300]|uniref:ATP-binding cassette domain-containing protein n=1 Tax=Kitasatospora sp. NBC_01300 TaxID=2903574 RepID=UPI00352E35A7
MPCRRTHHLRKPGSGFMMGGGPAEREAAPDCAVTLENVSKIHPGTNGPTAVLREFSLGVRKGRFCAVMGDERASTTALLECMAGVTTPSTGTVHWADGERGSVGALWGQHEPVHPNVTVREFVDPGVSALGRRQAWQISRVTRLWLWRRPLRRLGRVQQHNAMLARLLAGSPRLLLVDTPGHDDSPELARAIGASLRRAVRALDLTAVLVTTDPEAAACADSVVFLHHGRLADALGPSTPAEIADCLHHLRRGSTT